jgi:hypothetical protein
MSFLPFNNLSLSSIQNPFSSKQNNSENTFEIIKYITEQEMYTRDYSYYDNPSFSKTVDSLYYTINIGYISSKYVQNIKDTGTLIVMISSQIPEGPNAIFCLSRSDKSKSGDINTLVSSTGKCGDKLSIMWNPMEHPCLLLKHNFIKKQILKDDTKLRLGYNVRVIYI